MWLTGCFLDRPFEVFGSAEVTGDTVPGGSDNRLRPGGPGEIKELDSAEGSDVFFLLLVLVAFSRQAMRHSPVASTALPCPWRIAVM